MNLQSVPNAAAAALLALCAAGANAEPGPPLSCAGQPGVGGCAPYLNIYLSDGNGAINLYEYDLPRIDISRSRLLFDGRGTADLERGTLTAAARRAEDADPSNTLNVDVISTLVDVFTLHSTGGLPVGSPVGIVAQVSAQGVGSIDTDYQVVQSILHIGFGSGVSYNGGVLDHGSVLQAVTHVPVFQQFVVPLAVYANLTVQVGVPFDLNMSLRTIVTESSFLNFDEFFGLARPAQLSFMLQPGFSVTSMGGFDSSLPVPEPGTWALWLAGLAVMGGLRRRG